MKSWFLRLIAVFMAFVLCVAISVWLSLPAGKTMQGRKTLWRLAKPHREK